jgi:hypothetical protein
MLPVYYKYNYLELLTSQDFERVSVLDLGVNVQDHRVLCLNVS